MGASLGEIAAGKHLGKKAMLWGALAANVPDLDVFTQLWQPIPSALLSHRGFTHSILFCVLATQALAIIFFRIYKKKIPLHNWLWLWGNGLFSHILIDSLTNYGTGWFEPFSHHRIAFNTIFVADPFYTISLLLSFITLLAFRYRSPIRKYTLWAGVALSTTYLLFTFLNKYNVQQHFQKSFEQEFFSSAKVLTTPAPLNNFLWYGVGKTDTSFQLGYYSVFDKDKSISFHQVAQKAELIQPYQNDEEVKKLIRFSQGYYVAKMDSGKVNFSDIRFGQAGGWEKPDAPFVFNYNISEKQNRILIQQGRWEAITGSAFTSLCQRAAGKKP